MLYLKKKRGPGTVIEKQVSGRKRAQHKTKYMCKNNTIKMIFQICEKMMDHSLNNINLIILNNFLKTIIVIFSTFVKAKQVTLNMFPQ